MQITIHPIAGLPGQPDDTVSVSGDTITVNGTAFDLSAVPEGGEATPEGDHPFVGPITRTAGEIVLGLRLTYDATTAMPDQSDDPGAWRVAITSGTLPDPITRKPQEDVA